MNVIFSPAAQADLQDIWLYSAERWGRLKANSYLKKLKLVIGENARHSGQPCDFIRAGYFRLNYGSHVIFYRYSDDHMDVRRVLHQSMDFSRHL